jgi:valyl-tRNA synthetase
MNELAPRYNHADVESHWYSHWENSGAFHAADTSDRESFCIVIPPPNVTGKLHMGHALTVTIEDIMIRWHRMMGHETLWMPGTDHAGIATQMVVERDLHKTEGLSRHDLGREEFTRRIWEWKEQYGNSITEQLRVMGSSLDWERERFTMDDQLSRAVREVFVSLHEEGLIYRANRLINWCPRCHTALSDLEVVHEENHPGHLWHIAYPVTGEPGRELVVATTRPETMLGDTAVAVHPEDERYSDLIGKTVTLPLVNREIPVVGDDILVDREFGSGCVKVTPGHDFNDFETGRRHDLEKISIFDNDAKTNENTGEYAGLDRYDARDRVLADLEAQGLLRKVEDHSHAMGQCQRCETVIEPMLSDQWFVKTETLAKPAIEAVESGRVQILPETWTKTYFHWMNNIQDWCISRQLWWGHQIPAWYCDDCDHVTVSREDPTACAKCGSESIRREQDVLDTWFSSALWPFSTLGWPDDAPALKTFYPTNVMETGHDILFFWVARMMMMGMKFMGDVPFRTIYLHGMVLDKNGSKMSKVKGNVIDPLDITSEVGADSLRFYLAIMSGQGRSIKFDMERVIGYRNFINKVWNASRFALRYLEDWKPRVFDASSLKLSLADRWILSRMNRAVEDVTTALGDFSFDAAASGLYRFFWHEFCDWYIEMSKAALNNDADPDGQEAARAVLAHVLDVSLRLLNPIMPFVTEEIWQKLPVPREGKGAVTEPDTIMLASWPDADPSLIDDALESETGFAQDVISAIRAIRSQMHVPPNAEVSVHISVDPADGDAFTRYEAYGRDLARIGELVMGVGLERPASSATAVVGKTTVYVPLGDLIDLDAERARMRKEIGRIEGLLTGTRKKLDNPNFVSRAPEEVIEKEREKIVVFEASLAQLQTTLESISE